MWIYIYILYTSTVFAANITGHFRPQPGIFKAATFGPGWRQPLSAGPPGCRKMGFWLETIA